MKTYFTASALSIALVACGGGSDVPETANTIIAEPEPEPELSLQTANHLLAAKEAFSSAAYIENLGLAVMGAPAAPGSAAAAAGRMHALAATPLAERSQPLGVVRTQQNCAAGGRIESSVDDTNNNSRLDAGDWMTQDYQACFPVAGGARIDGKLSIKIDKLTGAYGSNSYNMDLTIQVEGFGTSSAAMQDGAQGTVLINAVRRSVNDMDVTVNVPTLTRTRTEAGAHSAVTVHDFTQTLTRRPAGTGFTDHVQTNTTLASSALGGEIAVSTTQQLRRSGASAYPSTGQVLLTGARGSRVRVTALSDSQVSIDLDADGNGAYELTSTQPWSVVR